MTPAVVVDTETTTVGEDGWCHYVCEECQSRLCDGQPDTWDHDPEGWSPVCECGLPNCPTCDDLADGDCPWCGEP